MRVEAWKLAEVGFLGFNPLFSFFSSFLCPHSSANLLTAVDDG